jgi:hypothetical protein
MLRFLGTVLLAFALTTAGCGGSKVARKAADPAKPQPITVQTPDIRVTLAGVLKEGDEGTLVKDKGWREYVLEIQNLTTDDLTVKDVRLLNPTGRYVESAASYGQIIVPPNTAMAVAEDVAKTGAGIAAGAIIPYGGYLVSVLTSATSTALSGTHGSAERTFTVRVLKGVELAAGGKVAGSAFLPEIPGSRALVIDYVQAHGKGRVEIPLPRAGKKPAAQKRSAPAAQSPSPAAKPPSAPTPPTPSPQPAPEAAPTASAAQPGGAIPAPASAPAHQGPAVQQSPAPAPPAGQPAPAPEAAETRPVWPLLPEPGPQAPAATDQQAAPIASPQVKP